ncbi:VOC family protein [Carboxylicivirga sp. N1Y90]|uniref:VOC family protein n=1 Tax=Carboxylicivirga fragile TaxID=3417571 RepID=UPI003D35493D|nr:VOC family protein [Marinilabiliaceae bacterium N1Y90]
MKRFFEWVEIPASNFQRAIDFYSTVFGLTFKVMDCGTEQMAFFPNGEGAISFAPGFTPSDKGVLVSINVESEIDKTIVLIQKNNGKIVIPKTKIEAEGKGYFATFIDSEGNQLGLYGNPE